MIMRRQRQRSEEVFWESNPPIRLKSPRRSERRRNSRNWVNSNYTLKAINTLIPLNSFVNYSILIYSFYDQFSPVLCFIISISSEGFFSSFVEFLLAFSCSLAIDDCLMNC